MPGYARPAEPRIVFLLLIALALACGCARQDGTPRFEIQNVDLDWSNGVLNVELQQNLALSNEARDALDNGVPLTLQLELILRDTASQTHIEEHRADYEIRYLPLSKLFQLTLPGGDEIRTFPRLRHLLADLSDLRFTLRTGVLPEGHFELMARTRIDRQKIPLSMRLPTLFDAEWIHDSAWSSWPLEISPTA